MMDKKKKECKSCFQVKPLEEFYENQYSPDGRYSFCKVCFDLFIRGEKQVGTPPAGFEKRCAKCREVKLLNEFYERPQSIEGLESWCKSCQAEYLKTEKQRKNNASQPEPKDNDKDLLPMEALIEEPPAPEEGAAEEPLDECIFLEMEIDEIKGLLTPQIEAAPPPKPRLDIMLKERRCNGCNRVEPVIEVTRKVRVPVHAWFCDICRQNNTRMYARRGFIVYDEYGREYKITKVLNDELVLGVVKKKDGRWGRKKVRVYGNWTARE